MADVSSRSWYEIRQADSGNVEVYIFDEIGYWGITAKQFVKDWKAATKGVKAVDLHINSPGGEVPDATAIYNTIKQSKKDVTVYVDGWAASAAATLAMVGDTVKMASNAIMMVHNPWSYAMGDAAALRETADILDKFKQAVMPAYMEKTGKSEAEISAIMDAETWMTADEAVDMGFADEVYAGVEAKQQWQPTKYQERFKNLRPEFIQSLGDVEEPAEAETQKEASAMPENSVEQTPTAPVPVDPEQIRQEATKAERDRVSAIRQTAYPGQDALVDKLIADGTAELEAVKQLVADHKTRQATTGQLVQMQANSEAITVTNKGGDLDPAKITSEQSVGTYARFYQSQGYTREDAEIMARRAAGVN